MLKIDNPVVKFRIKNHNTHDECDYDDRCYSIIIKCFVYLVS